MKTLLNVDEEEAVEYRGYLNDQNKRFTFQIGRMQLRPFYQLNLFWYFSPCVVVWRLVMGWTSNVVALLILFGVDDRTVTIVGAVAIFLGSLNLHFSHGFIQYPSVSKWCAHCDDRQLAHANNENFEVCRDIASAAYHGDTKRRSQIPAIVFTLPWTAPLHLASGLTTVVCCFVGLCDSNNQNNRNGAVQEVVTGAGVFGLLLGSLFFPIVFVAAGVGGVIYAQLGLIALENLYDAMFARKSFSKFLLSFLLGIFDVWFEEIENEAAEVTRDAIDNVAEEEDGVATEVELTNGRGDDREGTGTDDVSA